MTQTYSSSAQAVKNLDLRVSTFYGETQQTRKIMGNGDTVRIDAKTKYYWGWRVINDGPDSTEYGDTIRILSGVSTGGAFLLNPFNIAVEFTSGGGSSIPNMPANDTAFYVPSSNNIAYSALTPHGSITTSQVNAAQVWCDTIWCVAGPGNKAVNELNPADNGNCPTTVGIFWLVSVEGIQQPSTDVFMLFPNPTNDKVNLRHTFDPGNEAVVTVVDVTGRVVYTQQLGKLSGTQDVPIALPANLAKGMYMLQLREGEKLMSERIHVD